MGRRALSMVTEPFARKGAVFQPLLTGKCLSCQFFNVCIGTMRPLVSYRVVEVRKHFNLCPALSERLQVVLVEELPVRLVVEIPFVAPGAVIQYRKPNCPDIPACDTVSVGDGERIRLLQGLQRIRERLWLVEAELLDSPSPRLWLLAKQKLLRCSS
ncbi:MAG: UPF0179 family protein [Thermofilum sp.]